MFGLKSGTGGLRPSVVSVEPPPSDPLLAFVNQLRVDERLSVEPLVFGGTICLKYVVSVWCGEVLYRRDYAVSPMTQRPDSLYEALMEILLKCRKVAAPEPAITEVYQQP
jgi:hypothetical protein